MRRDMGDLCLCYDLFLDPEAQTLWSYTKAIGQFQQDTCLYGVNQDPKYSFLFYFFPKDTKEPPLYVSRDSSPN